MKPRRTFWQPSYKITFIKFRKSIESQEYTTHKCSTTVENPPSDISGDKHVRHVRGHKAVDALQDYLVNEQAYRWMRRREMRIMCRHVFYSDARSYTAKRKTEIQATGNRLTDGNFSKKVVASSMASSQRLASHEF